MLLAGSLWHKDRWLPCTERIYLQAPLCHLARLYLSPDSVYTGPHHQPARQDSPELGGLPGEEVAGSVDQTEDQDYTLYTTTPHQSDITGHRN